MPHLVTRLWYMSCSSSNTNHVKTRSCSISYKCSMLYNWKRSIKQKKSDIRSGKQKKETHFLTKSTSLFFTNLQRFINNTKKTYKSGVSRHRPVSSILEHRNDRWEFPNIGKTRFLQTYIGKITHCPWNLMFTVLQVNHCKIQS